MSESQERLGAAWQQIALELGNSVHRAVNTADMIGTDNETGYALLFFNAKNHNGKATLISSASNPGEIEKILKYTLRHINERKIVSPPSRAN